VLEWEIAGERGDLRAGQLLRVPLPAGREAEAALQPRRGVDIGEGPGRGWKGRLQGGTAGVVLLDGRGRPLHLPDGESERLAKLDEWMRAAGALPGRE